MKAKLPLIVLLVLLIISALITVQFYSDKQNLLSDNQTLKKDRAKLSEENNSLRSQYKNLETRYASNKERLDNIQEELSKVSREKEDLKNRYAAIYKEREQLVSKLKGMVQIKSTAAVKENNVGPRGTSSSSDEYWSGVVRQKAELQAKLEELQKQLLDTKTEIFRLQKDNKELSLKIDEVNKAKDSLEMDLAFKERTMDIMSRNLVNEREARKALTDEIGKLRDENIGLKREIIVANKDKIQLQSTLKDMIKKKDVLEKTVGEVQDVLKEKKMMFSELESQLTKAVGINTGAKNSASVELPPIVVKSDVSGKSLTGKPLKGEVLAVNKNDNFVIIDIGENSGVKPGLKFNIVRSGKTIGNVEVIETRREISAADIKGVNAGYTIREGDTVIVR